MGELHDEIARLEGESGGAEGAMEARRLAAAARARSYAALPGESGRVYELALAYGSFAASCREAGKRNEALAVFRLAHWMMKEPDEDFAVSACGIVVRYLEDFTADKKAERCDRCSGGSRASTSK